MKHSQLSLKSAEEKDCRLLWKWRNEKETRKFSFDSRFIPYERHKHWFVEKLKSSNTKILILLDFRKRGIGQIRFEKNHNGIVEISISIDKNERNKGYATKGLKFACEYAFNNLKVKVVRAHIKENNEASLKVFIKAGFINNGLKKFKNHQCYEVSLGSNHF